MESKNRLRNQASSIQPSEIKLLLLAFLPIAALILGHLLFDIVGASFASHVIQIIPDNGSTAMAESSIASAQIWGAASLIYLVIGTGSLIYAFRFLKTNIRGKGLFPFLALASFFIATGITHLMWVDADKRPVSMIFYLTFDSLKSSNLLQPDGISNIRGILDFINALSVIVPSLFCAFMPSVLLTPCQGWTQESLTNRIKLGRQFCVCSSIFLVVGIFHMFAWMKWSAVLLGKPELGQLAFGVVFFWSFVFSTMIAILHLCIMSTLHERCDSLGEDRESSPTQRPELLGELGLAFNGITQVRQAATIFGPVISALTVSISSPVLEAGI